MLARQPEQPLAILAASSEPSGRYRGLPGVPLGMSKIRPKYLVPDLAAAYVFLREEPDEEDEEGEDDEEENDNEDEDNDEGYSP